MSAEEKNGAMRMASVEKARILLDQWSEALAQVLESMTDQRPETHWQYAAGPFSTFAADPGGYLWWQQPFQLAPQMTVWVAAPKTAWEFAGTLTLKAAGLETVDPGEARNTWFEILGQSLSVMARTIGSMVGQEVSCDTGAEQAADATVEDWGIRGPDFRRNRAPAATGDRQLQAVGGHLGARRTAGVPQANCHP